MTDASLVELAKLAEAGEKVGLSINQMFAMLHEDLSIKNLLHLIERDQSPPVFVPNSSRWIL
jgi:hypothetical protein